MTAELKSYLFSLVFVTDELDEKGKQIPRAAFSKDVYKGCMDLKKKLLSACEVGWLKNGQDKETTLIKDLDWKPVGEQVEGATPVVEKFLETELDFSEKEKEAVKYYFKSKKDVPQLPDATVKELNDIFSLGL